MKLIAKGTRVHHPRHGAGTVIQQGVVRGTVLVHYDNQRKGFAKVAKVRDLARGKVAA